MSKEIKKISITDLLKTDNQKTDLLTENSTYSKNLESVIFQIKTLVFEPTEKGDKEAKQTATAINQYAISIKKDINDEFKNKTSTLSDAKNELLEKVKIILDIRQSIIDQSAERRDKKLAEIRELLIYTLAREWNNNRVRCEYQCDTQQLEKAVLLSSVTAKDSLTKKAKDFVVAVCDADSKRQDLNDSRAIVLENLCMKAGVDSNALAKEYLGNAFYAPDEVFNARVEELLAIEIDKKEQRAIKIEADKKKAVDDALKSHQAETNRIIAEEKAELNRLAKQEELPQKPVTRLVDRTSPSVEQIHSEEPENNPEKRTVTVLVTFEIQNVPSTASNKGVESMVKRYLSEKQVRAFKSIESLL